MSDGEKRLRDLKDATDHELKMKAALDKAKADAAAGALTLSCKIGAAKQLTSHIAGKTGGGLFGKKPVPIEELEASYVAATSAVRDKSDL